MTVEFSNSRFRRRGERFADNCLIERDRFGGWSVMVWGGIMGRRKTNLIVVQGNLTAQGYINQILQPEAVPCLQRHGSSILMDDNARPHFARPRGLLVKCLTRNPGVLGSSRTGSSGFFRGSVLGQDTSEPSLVLVKPKKE